MCVLMNSSTGLGWVTHNAKRLKDTMRYSNERLYQGCDGREGEKKIIY